MLLSGIFKIYIPKSIENDFINVYMLCDNNIKYSVFMLDSLEVVI